MHSLPVDPSDPNYCVQWAVGMYSLLVSVGVGVLVAGVMVAEVEEGK